jgi:hypothetical protein
VDAADDQDIVLQLNLADRLRHQSLIRSVYVTRLQRFRSVNPQRRRQYSPG